MCVLDAQGNELKRLTARHTAPGLGTLCSALEKVAREKPPIAVERPTGLLVDTLVAAGFPVVPIHPNVAKACRSRYSAAGGKSDRGDAYMLADLLRTDAHRFRPLSPLSDELRALRSLVRTRTRLVTERVALANQLRSTLESYWPGAARIFSEVDSLIALSFVERYPTPESAKRLGAKRLAGFLSKHKYPGARTAKELLERLRAAPRGVAGTLEQGANACVVQSYVLLLRGLRTSIRELTSRIEKAVLDLPRGRVIASFPRAGKVNAAQILAEVGDDPARFQTEEQLAAEAGVAPVTYASGKSRGVRFRRACNKRLRRALTGWADNSRRESEWARDVYQRARDRGQDHPHAVRTLARAWTRVLWRCWRDGTHYDPTRHGGAMRMAAKLP